MRRVLVIGEGSDQAKALGLRLAGLGIEASTSAGELALAVRTVLRFRPHLILFDTASAEEPRDLFGFLLDITDLPIVVLGDLRDQDDLIWYLGNGAADYISRSVPDSILLARLTAILRRIEASEPGGVMEIGSLQIDVERHQVRKDGEPVQLTPTEFRILRILAENAGKPCDHAMLLQEVWGEEFRQCAHYLRLYVGYLRQKIEDDPKTPRILLTEWGVGYQLVPDRSPAAAPSATRARAAIA